MLQHYFHMSYAYYKIDNQMYCMGLSDNPTQKNYTKFCFLFLSKTIYMYKANITLLYLMCAVEG